MTVLIYICDAIAIAAVVLLFSGVIGWAVGSWLDQRNRGYRCAWEQPSNVRVVERPVFFDQDAVS